MAAVPGEPLEEVTLPQIIKYYKELLNGVSSDKYVFDSFPPGCDKPELIQQFLSIGSASWILNIVVD